MKKFEIPTLMLKSWYPSSSPYILLDYIVSHIPDFISGTAEEIKRDIERNKTFYCYRCRTEHANIWFILEDKRKNLQYMHEYREELKLKNKIKAQKDRIERLFGP